MTRLVVLAMLLLLPLVGWAQPMPMITWNHDGLNVTRFECVVDSGPPTDLGLPVPSGTTYAAEVASCPAVLVNGTHTLVIQACNGTQCAASTAITVVKM